MNKDGEIIIVEDDTDDQELMISAIKELGISNKVTVLADGQKAYEYFNHTRKDLFIIISDINMPKMSGTELRDKMQQTGELKLRTVPFLFLTNGAPADNVIEAYAHSVQGFFRKPNTYDQLRATVKTIFDYWSKCTEPSFGIIRRRS